MTCLGWILAALAIGFLAGQRVSEPETKAALAGWRECVEIAKSMHVESARFRETLLPGSTRKHLTWAGTGPDPRRGIGGPEE